MHEGQKVGLVEQADFLEQLSLLGLGVELLLLLRLLLVGGFGRPVEHDEAQGLHLVGREEQLAGLARDIVPHLLELGGKHICRGPPPVRHRRSGGRNAALGRRCSWAGRGAVISRGRSGHHLTLVDHRRQECRIPKQIPSIPSEQR